MWGPIECCFAAAGVVLLGILTGIAVLQVAGRLYASAVPKRSSAVFSPSRGNRASGGQAGFYHTHFSAKAVKSGRGERHDQRKAA